MPTYRGSNHPHHLYHSNFNTKSVFIHLNRACATMVMKYSLMADAYEKIESTTKRLEMTNYLVEFLKNVPKDVIDKVAYLTQGKLYPDFTGIEIGVA